MDTPYLPVFYILSKNYGCFSSRDYTSSVKVTAVISSGFTCSASTTVASFTSDSSSVTGSFSATAFYQTEPFQLYVLPAAKVSVPAAPSAMETTEVASVPVTLPFAAVVMVPLTVRTAFSFNNSFSLNKRNHRITTTKSKYAYFHKCCKYLKKLCKLLFIFFHTKSFNNYF